jgi:23S rRNA (adenine1618-N6)-methyltransferase
MAEFHPKNLHQGHYDFSALKIAESELNPFVVVNEYNAETIDFGNPEAVEMLNRAILKKDYGLQFWDIPEGYLCPPIPGRAEYIHRVAELLGTKKIPSSVTVMDIGTGANLIYPIIGASSYGWQFVATDIEPHALANAKKIIDLNSTALNKIELRQQTSPHQIFKGVMKSQELWDITICNPPFHASAEAAKQQSMRKIKNLTGEKNAPLLLNFGGQDQELWCEGGEVQFIQNMMLESADYAKNCFWFTTLVSQKDHLIPLQKTLEALPIKQQKTIEWINGNKQTRFLAWTFLTPQQQKEWKLARWY